jgi:hypothetical protein
MGVTLGPLIARIVLTLRGSCSFLPLIGSLTSYPSRIPHDASVAKEVRRPEIKVNFCFTHSSDKSGTQSRKNYGRNHSRPENKGVGAGNGPLLHSAFMRFRGPKALRDKLSVTRPGVASHSARGASRTLVTHALSFILSREDKYPRCHKRL